MQFSKSRFIYPPVDGGLANIRGIELRPTTPSRESTHFMAEVACEDAASIIR